MPAVGVPVRLVLAEVAGSAVAGEAPAIEAASAGEALQTETDDSGRVYWDEIAVVQGSGAARIECQNHVNENAAPRCFEGAQCCRSHSLLPPQLETVSCVFSVPE